MKQTRRVVHAHYKSNWYHSRLFNVSAADLLVCGDEASPLSLQLLLQAGGGAAGGAAPSQLQLLLPNPLLLALALAAQPLRLLLHLHQPGRALLHLRTQLGGARTNTEEMARLWKHGVVRTPTGDGLKIA